MKINKLFLGWPVLCRIQLNRLEMIRQKKKPIQFNNKSLKIKKKKPTHRPTQCYYRTEHISPCRSVTWTLLTPEHPQEPLTCLICSSLWRHVLFIIQESLILICASITSFFFFPLLLYSAHISPSLPPCCMNQVCLRTQRQDPPMKWQHVWWWFKRLYRIYRRGKTFCRPTQWLV